MTTDRQTGVASVPSYCKRVNWTLCRNSWLIFCAPPGTENAAVMDTNPSDSSAQTFPEASSSSFPKDLPGMA